MCDRLERNSIGKLLVYHKDHAFRRCYAGIDIAWYFLWCNLCNFTLWIKRRWPRDIWRNVVRARNSLKCWLISCWVDLIWTFDNYVGDRARRLPHTVRNEYSWRSWLNKFCILEIDESKESALAIRNPSALLSQEWNELILSFKLFLRRSWEKRTFFHRFRWKWGMHL